MDGLTESATTSTEQAQSNLKAMRTYIQDLSTQIPRTTEQISKMSAALGQSGIGADRQMSTGILRDTAVAATAMDLEDDTAGNYMAKWEAAFNFNHDQVMTLMDQINYLGANNATTAAEIAQSVNQAASMGQIAGVDPSATAAIATAMQESRLTNLDYGDLDSLGLFQQRPSQGWGTAEQVSDMTYATNIFYDHLLQVPDWETIPVEDAAQEVQRSGYPELYAAWDAMARAWASGLTGERSAGVTCALEPATSSDADGLVAAIGGTLPNVNVSVVPPNGKTGTNNGAATNTASTTLTITLPDGLSADNRTRLCWQTAGWLVTHARQYGIDALHADGMDWNRKAGTWIGTETAEQTITFTLA